MLFRNLRVGRMCREKVRHPMNHSFGLSEHVALGASTAGNIQENESDRGPRRPETVWEVELLRCVWLPAYIHRNSISRSGMIDYGNHMRNEVQKSDPSPSLIL